MENKTCTNCGEVKYFYYFQMNRTRTGFTDLCSKCHGRLLRKSNNKKRIDSFHDEYISQLIARSSGIPKAEIPKELVEAKRAHLQLVRTLKKEKNNGNC